MAVERSDSPIARFHSHVATIVSVALISLCLFHANTHSRYSTLGNDIVLGWPLSFYSYYGIFSSESFEFRALLTDMVVAVWLAGATGWGIESWARRGFRLTVAALLKVTAVAAVLCSLITCGIISLTSGMASTWDSEFGQCVAVIFQAVTGESLTIEFYGATAIEYVFYVPLFLALGFVVYGAGRLALPILRLPFKILSPGPFRWR